MNLVFLYGIPAVGKLTIARELEKLTGYKVFHNHLTVDLVTEVFSFGTPEFVKLRERIWIDVMKEAALAKLSGLTFTFAPERTVLHDFVSRLQAEIKSAGGRVCFVNLVCSEADLIKRMTSETRQGFKKLKSVVRYHEMKFNGTFEFPAPPVDLKIDTSYLSPAEAAVSIQKFLKESK